jgi:hypothetical protein
MPLVNKLISLHRMLIDRAKYLYQSYKELMESHKYVDVYLNEDLPKIADDL